MADQIGTGEQIKSAHKRKTGKHDPETVGHVRVGNFMNKLLMEKTPLEPEGPASDPNSSLERSIRHASKARKILKGRRGKSRK